MPREISVGFGVQLNDGLGAGVAANYDFDSLTAGRPDAEMNIAVLQNFRADGEPSCISITGLCFRGEEGGATNLQRHTLTPVWLVRYPSATAPKDRPVF